MPVVSAKDSSGKPFFVNIEVKSGSERDAIVKAKADNFKGMKKYSSEAAAKKASKGQTLQKGEEIKEKMTKRERRDKMSSLSEKASTSVGDKTISQKRSNKIAEINKEIKKLEKEHRINDKKVLGYENPERLEKEIDRLKMLRMKINNNL